MVVAGLVHPSNIPSASTLNNPIMFPGTGYVASFNSTVSVTSTSSTSSSSNALPSGPPTIPSPVVSSATSDIVRLSRDMALSSLFIRCHCSLLFHKFVSHLGQLRHSALMGV